MLVLSRKKGEQIRIGDDVVITIHRMSGNRVSIGIEAPESYRIVRGELESAIAAAVQAPEATPPRKRLNPTMRPLRNVPADKAGENRISAHLPQSMRTV